MNSPILIPGPSNLRAMADRDLRFLVLHRLHRLGPAGQPHIAGLAVDGRPDVLLVPVLGAPGLLDRRSPMASSTSSRSIDFSRATASATSSSSGRAIAVPCLGLSVAFARGAGWGRTKSRARLGSLAVGRCGCRLDQRVGENETSGSHLRQGQSNFRSVIEAEPSLAPSVPSMMPERLWRPSSVGVAISTLVAWLETGSSRGAASTAGRSGGTHLQRPGARHDLQHPERRRSDG